MKLTISKQGMNFVVDNKAIPGCPPVGRGRTMKEAVGDWLHHNKKELGISFELDATAQPAEKRRRARELSKR